MQCPFTHGHLHSCSAGPHIKNKLAYTRQRLPITIEPSLVRTIIGHAGCVLRVSSPLARVMNVGLHRLGSPRTLAWIPWPAYQALFSRHIWRRHACLGHTQNHSSVLSQSSVQLVTVKPCWCFLTFLMLHAHAHAGLRKFTA